MKDSRTYLGVVLTVILLLVVGGCTAAPASAPTQAPAKPAPTSAPAAAPTSAPAPTAAPTAQPTAAPAKALNWPEKGKTITLIIPWATGGPNDIFGRLIAPFFEKEFGVPVVAENKPGASTQVGATELVHSKPDGYTIYVNALPVLESIYMDPTRQAGFNRQSFQALANMGMEPNVFSVKADSPYKTAKDLIDAAKADPGKIKAGSPGILSVSHMGILMLEKAAGVKFATVQFNSGGENLTSLLGGHTDLLSVTVSGTVNQIKSGELIGIGVCSDTRDPFLPDVKTFTEQGYPGVVIGSTRGIIGPAGMPKEIVQRYSDGIKKITSDPAYISKAKGLGFGVTYMDSEQLSKYWDNVDVQVKPMLEGFWAEQKK